MKSSKGTLLPVWLDPRRSLNRSGAPAFPDWSRAILSIHLTRAQNMGTSRPLIVVEEFIPTVSLTGRLNKPEEAGWKGGNLWGSPGDAGAPKWLGLDEALTDRVADEARRVVKVQLLHDSGAIRLGSLDGQPKHHRNLLRGLPFSD
jgi:hypothetical protein